MKYTREQIIKQLTYRLNNIRWALENNDPKFGLNHLSHLELILEEEKS